ncbi:MAG: hypothetical protein ACOYI8_01380 [Christensenellales bacterium]|jgi:hypothetical protein
MYTDADFINAKNAMRRAILISMLICLVPFAFFIMGLILRYRILVIAMAIIWSWLFYALLQIKCLPHIRYVLWLKDMRNGLSRELVGRFVRISPETRLSDGIAVHDMIVTIGNTEEDERLFLWDDDKPIPAFEEGQLLRVKSFGNYVIKIE